MSWQEFGLLLVSILTSTLGQLFLKLGALKLGKVTAGNVFSHVLSIAATPELILGLLSYGMGAIAYILLLTRVRLSIAAPSASLIYFFPVQLVGSIEKIDQQLNWTPQYSFERLVESMVDHDLKEFTDNRL